jgi:hypothetical protein
VRFQRGAMSGTGELVYENFTGTVRLGSESKGAEATLLLKNGEIALSGGVRVRPQPCSEALYDPEDGSLLDDDIICLINQQKATQQLHRLLACSTRLFKTCPGHSPNLKELLLDGAVAFPDGIKYVSSAPYLGKVYMATGTHHLLRYDGRQLEDMSAGYEENYRYPGCVVEHRGHLILSGFTDIKDSRAASQIRIAGSEYDITDTTKLMEFFEEFRTEDDERVLAMVSMPYGLYAFKSNSVVIMTGSDFVNFTDTQKFQLPTTRGICGPMAWCVGEYGLYYMSNWGVHLIPFSAPTKVVDVSLPISEVWSHRARGSNWYLPSAKQGQLWRATMAFDKERRQVFCLFPMTGDPR